EIISHVIGIDTTSSILYTIFNKYDILSKRYLDGIKEYLGKNISQSFSEFVNYLWSSQTTKFNVFSYKNIGNYSEIYKFHPNLSSYDKYKIANKYDIEYIKNVILREENVNGTTLFQVLGEDGLYYDINNISQIIGMPIKSKADLDAYIDKHHTINNLQDIIHKIDSSTKNKIQKVSFRNNVSNNLIISKKTNVVTHSKAPINLIYLAMILLLALGMKKQINKKITKGDIK
ncbi:MAG: hypothetical protein HRT98_04495, partial [Mycoplasmatales bacterium]|nr:hypothetical protein [Mycoplasmatales bacterium]